MRKRVLLWMMAACALCLIINWPKESEEQGTETIGESEEISEQMAEAIIQSEILKREDPIPWEDIPITGDESGSIMPTFSRALPKNLQELSQIVANLKDRVSERTLLKLLPFVEDPDYEIEQTMEQKKQAIKDQQEMFAVGANTAPEFGDEEEEEAPKKEEKEDPKKEDKKEEKPAAGSEPSGE